MPNQHEDREFMTMREAAEFVRVSEATMRRYLTLKKLKRYKFGVRTLIKKSELLSLIKLEEK